MTMNQKSSHVHPAVYNYARSVISISNGTSEIEESMMEPDTDLDLENNLAYQKIGGGLTVLMSQRQAVSTGLTAG